MQHRQPLSQRTILSITILSLIVFISLGAWSNNDIVGSDKLSQRLSLNPIQKIDYKVAESINTYRTPETTYFLSAITHIADTKASSQISITILILLAIFAHRRYLIVFVLNMGLLAGAIPLFKHLFDRPRPGMLAHDTLPQMLIDVGGLSYPSGHAAFATIIFIFFSWFAVHTIKHNIWRIVSVSLVGTIALFICYSRMYLGVHFASDILGGILLSIALSSFSLWVTRKFVTK